MARKERPWIVTPHSPIQKLDSNLWVVESAVPGMKVPRRMSMVRLADDSIIFYHAIPLDEPTLTAVLEWGKPRALVIGHHQHGVDAHAFAQKLNIDIYGPKEHELKMRARWPNSRNLEELPADAACRFESLAGTRWGEPVQLVTSAGGVSLVWCDAFSAMENSEISLFSRLLGFGGGARIPLMFRLFLTRDTRAFKAHLERLAATPKLTRLIPCHGKIITDNAAEVLRRAAAVL